MLLIVNVLASEPVTSPSVVLLGSLKSVPSVAKLVIVGRGRRCADAGGIEFQVEVARLTRDGGRIHLDLKQEISPRRRHHTQAGYDQAN